MLDKQIIKMIDRQIIYKQIDRLYTKRYVDRYRQIDGQIEKENQGLYKNKEEFKK